MAKPKRIRAYVVQRRNWWYNDEYHMPLDETPVKTFLSREKAEAYRLQQEHAARKKGEFTNPFWLAGLSWDDWSSTSQEEFDRRLRELDVRPLGRQYPSEWWEEVERNLTDEQRNAIWDLLDRVQLFVVEETAVEVVE
jgi:hypothetical protein